MKLLEGLNRKFQILKIIDSIKGLKKRRVYDDQTKVDIIYCLLRTFANVEEGKLMYTIHGLGINSLYYENKKDKMVVYIELSRPGLLIGKAGSTIDGFKDQLIQQFKKEVDIKIIEDLSSDQLLIKEISARYTDNYSW